MADWDKESIFDLINNGSVDISSGITKVVETIPMNKFNCLEYTVCIKNELETLVKTLKIQVSKNNSDIKETVYAKNGNAINIGITCVQSGSNFELTFVNNESFLVKVNFARLKT